MNINVSRISCYDRHGCNIRGNLLLFEYWDALKLKKSNTPLNGFGQCDFVDFITIIKDLLKEGNVRGTKKLSIPDFVFKLDDSMTEEEIDSSLSSIATKS